MGLRVWSGGEIFSKKIKTKWGGGHIKIITKGKKKNPKNSFTTPPPVLERVVTF